MYVYIYILSVGRTPARYHSACIPQIFIFEKPFDLSFWNYNPFFFCWKCLFQRIYSNLQHKVWVPSKLRLEPLRHQSLDSC